MNRIRRKTGDEYWRKFLPQADSEFIEAIGATQPAEEPPVIRAHADMEDEIAACTKQETKRKRGRGLFACCRMFPRRKSKKTCKKSSDSVMTQTERVTSSKKRKDHWIPISESADAALDQVRPDPPPQTAASAPQSNFIPNMSEVARRRREITREAKRRNQPINNEQLKQMSEKLQTWQRQQQFAHLLNDEEFLRLHQELTLGLPSLPNSLRKIVERAKQRQTESPPKHSQAERPRDTRLTNQGNFINCWSQSPIISAPYGHQPRLTLYFHAAAFTSNSEPLGKKPDEEEYPASSSSPQSGIEACSTDFCFSDSTYSNVYQPVENDPSTVNIADLEDAIMQLELSFAGNDNGVAADAAISEEDELATEL